MTSPKPMLWVMKSLQESFQVLIMIFPAIFDADAPWFFANSKILPKETWICGKFSQNSTMGKLETGWLMWIDWCTRFPNHYSKELNIVSLYKYTVLGVFLCWKQQYQNSLRSHTIWQGAPPGAHFALGVVFSAYHKICQLKIAQAKGCPNDICKREKVVKRPRGRRALGRGLPRVAASHLLLLFPQPSQLNYF